MSENFHDSLAPSLALIEDLARQALQSLPPDWRIHAQAILLRVENFAPDEILEDMDVDNPYELTGLYEGIPLTMKSVSDQPMGPDVIWLFRRPILDEWIERETVSLSEMVTHVVIHELAHHFGWSDDDIAQIDPWWE